VLSHSVSMSWFQASL